MISVEEALQIVLNSAQDFGVEEDSVYKSVGRILKEEIPADRDFPPFNRVSMDGIAIDYPHFKKGQRDFKIEGIQAAGSEQITLKIMKTCIEVMTGAYCQINTNTVIRYEDLSSKRCCNHIYRTHLRRSEYSCRKEKMEKRRCFNSSRIQEFLQQKLVF